jgi:simple sugar transport system permease protein
MRANYMDLQQKISPYLSALTRWKSMGSFIMFIVVFLGFYCFTGPVLVGTLQIKNFLTFGVEMSIMAMGVAMLMIAGEFDLSVGSVFGLSACTLFVIQSKFSFNPWLSFFMVLLLCAGIGALHGIITIKSKIPSFIVTLAGLMLWRAATIIITGGRPAPVPEQALDSLRSILAHKLIGGWFLTSFPIFILLFIVLWIILERTPFGNRVFATGGNINSARVRGAQPDKIKLLLFISCSTLAGLAGLLRSVRVFTAHPMFGEGYELRMIAAAVIGGVSLRGGVGSLPGAVIGAILLRVIRNGIVLAGISGAWYRVFIGLIILVAVVFNRFIDDKTRSKL